MKAYFIVKHGPSASAFELRETPVPQPGDDHVLVKATSFGLNYADVMSRMGLYRAAPPPPFIPGYEVVGYVEAVGKNVKEFSKGQRVLAFCRFGGYAEYVCSDRRAVIAIPEEWGDATAAALATQYCTAWYAAIMSANLREGEHVLINSAAGGVGTALMQIATWKKCRITGTSGSDGKLLHIRRLGAGTTLNYNSPRFEKELDAAAGQQGFDVIFDSSGGKIFRKCFKRLGTAGRMVGYGAASRTKIKALFPTLKLALDFGFLHPALLLMKSRSVIGVNMLVVAEQKPEILQECLVQVVKHCHEGILKPVEGGTYHHSKLAEAHDHLASGKSVGKLCVSWS